MADYVLQDTLEIHAGSTFFQSWPVTDADTDGPADLSSWSARCEVRTDYGGALVTRFHSDSGHGWDGTITLQTVAQGANLILGLTAAKTALLSKLPPTARFDVELVDPSGQPTAVVFGQAIVYPEVTTDA